MKQHLYSHSTCTFKERFPLCYEVCGISQELFYLNVRAVELYDTIFSFQILIPKLVI